jgi:deoxyribonuclease-4
MMNDLLLGAHMSIAGGLFRALDRGESIQCRTIQMFTHNNTRWAIKDLESEEIEAFKKRRSETGISPVFAHCSYLINLAAHEFYEASIAALTAEVRRAEQLGLDFIVLHPGAHRGLGELQGLQLVTQAIDRVCEATAGAYCKIVLENTAGQGSCVGFKFEHLEYILTHTKHPDRVGFCIDTCHLFAAGYDIRKKKAYRETFRRLLDHLPLSSVLAIHLNDSKKPLGSRVDRHEHIGKGQIGREAFQHLLHDARFENTPKVLETPKGNDLAEDVMNLKLLSRLARIQKTSR